MVDYNDPDFLLADIDPTPEREYANKQAANSTKHALAWGTVIIVGYIIIIMCTLFNLI